MVLNIKELSILKAHVTACDRKNKSDRELFSIRGFDFDIFRAEMGSEFFDIYISEKGTDILGIYDVHHSDLYQRLCQIIHKKL